jgi:hypothetical protein
MWRSTDDSAQSFQKLRVRMENYRRATGENDAGRIVGVKPDYLSIAGAGKSNCVRRESPKSQDSSPKSKASS